MKASHLREKGINGELQRKEGSVGKGWKMKPAGPGCEPGHRLAAPQALGLPSGGWWRSRTSPRPAGRRGPTWQPPERPPLGARGGGGAGRGRRDAQGI